MKSQIAENVLTTSFSLSPAASLPEARSMFPNLREVEPDYWAARLSGGYRDDAIGIRIKLRDAKMVEICVRATAWNIDEGSSAWNGLTRTLKQRLGKPAKSGKGTTFSRRAWPVRRCETVTAEKRVSDEGGFLLSQIILVRTFAQPDATDLAADSLSLFGLLDEAGGPTVAAASPSSRQHMLSRTPATDAQSRRITYTGGPTDYADSFTFKGGPRRPKWPNGKSRPIEAFAPVDGPCFSRLNWDVDAAELPRELAALDTAFDARFEATEWRPYYYADREGIRHHSARWWWLGGGLMLHVCVRGYDSDGDGKSTILVEGYHELDCPPQQAVRPTPTFREALKLIDDCMSSRRAIMVSANRSEP